MSVVLDASVVLSWCFEDEQDDAADSLLDDVVSGGAIVPTLWDLEIANVLVVAERLGRITAADRHRIIGLLSRLPIEVSESDPTIGALASTAVQHGVSAYDASYLLCAMREGLPLATLDRSLAQAALESGVGLALQL